MKRDLLTVPLEKIIGIELGDIVAEKEGDDWTLAGLKEGETVKQDQLQRLIGAAVNPGFDRARARTIWPSSIRPTSPSRWSVPKTLRRLPISSKRRQRAAPISSSAPNRITYSASPRRPSNRS